MKLAIGTADVADDLASIFDVDGTLADVDGIPILTIRAISPDDFLFKDNPSSGTGRNATDDLAFNFDVDGDGTLADVHGSDGAGPE